MVRSRGWGRLMVQGAGTSDYMFQVFVMWFSCKFGSFIQGNVFKLFVQMGLNMRHESAF
jgi:hypothetical protein